MRAQAPKVGQGGGQIMNHIEQLREIVGSAYIVTESKDLAVIGCDWTKVFKIDPLCAVLPASTAEVAEVVTYCHKHKIPVVPSGGRTGLAGGAAATNREVVISLTRMSRIEYVDATGMTICCEAGVTTQALQEAAKNVGLFFALDLAAKGSSQIGGNISTNAGGLKLIRYGGTREQVLGIEVVLPNGEVLDMMSSLRKNNTGYDLKQLFIGAEGTLGIVTRAVLRLMPQPRNLQLACMGVKDFAKIPAIMTLCNTEGAQITAFEFFTDVAHEIVLKHTPGARTPFDQRMPYYVILEVEEGPGGAKIMEALLETAFAQDLVVDAVIAQNSTQFRDLWNLRENITESISAHGQARKNDICLPIDKLAPFIAELNEVLATAPKELDLVLFGHIGDGNLHLNYVGAKSIAKDTFQALAREVEERVFAKLPKYRGSVSAEHGIGLLKKADLGLSRNRNELNLMVAIKNILDPHTLMNPGKIFDV